MVLQIVRRLEEIPIQELGLGDILRLWRTLSPDPDGLPDCGKEGNNAALEFQRGVTSNSLTAERTTMIRHAHQRERTQGRSRFQVSGRGQAKDGNTAHQVSDPGLRVLQEGSCVGSKHDSQLLKQLKTGGNFIISWTIIHRFLHLSSGCTGGRT